MKWEESTLGAISKVITKGTTPSNIGHDFTDSGINYIRSEMITANKRISDTGMLYISPLTHEKLSRSQLHSGDILFSMAGIYLGKTALLRAQDIPANTNQAVALIRLDESKCCIDYVYYFLNLPRIITYINSINSQATQPNINLKQIGNIPIILPSIETQRRITDILSAYDDLIENNQKQIKLLEEAAQRLYNEWFVDLRFPGHENTQIVDGVPEGWKKTTIGNETEVKRGGSPRPIQDYLTDDGLNWLKISDATASNTPYIYLIKEKIRPEGLKKTVFMKAGSIILSNSATPGIPRILKVDTCIHDGWLYFSNLQLSNEYMYHLFLQIRNDLVNRGTGAVFTNLKTDILKNYEFIKPDEYTLILYDKNVKPIFSMIDNLSKQVLMLKEARDRLLPKLMSGELEV